MGEEHLEPAKPPDLQSVTRKRSLKLVGTVAATLAVVWGVDWIVDTAAFDWTRRLFKDSDVFGPLFFPDGSTIEWKDRLQGMVLLLGLPVAYLLWYWRDRNVRDQIEEQRRQVENARKDINLKEFQEIKLHVVGVFDDSVPIEAQEQLQITALYQLRPFLRGDYGEDFKRPAFELLLTGHAQAMEKIGTRAACAEFENGADTKNNESISNHLEFIKSKLTSVMKHRMDIIESEAHIIFSSGYNLKNRNFDLLKFKITNEINKVPYPKGREITNLIKTLDFSESSFIKSDLQESFLAQCCFERSFCVATDFDRCNLRQAHFDNANISGSYFSNANIRATYFSCTNWRRAHFDGADFGKWPPALGDNKSWAKPGDRSLAELMKLINRNR